MQRSASTRIGPKFNLVLPPRTLQPFVATFTLPRSHVESMSSVPLALDIEQKSLSNSSHSSPIASSETCELQPFSKVTTSSLQVCRASVCRPNFEATCVTPSIYLGSYMDALNTELILEHGIKRVLNISIECPIPESLLAHRDTIETMQVPIKDHGDEQIQEYFKDCIEFIHDGVSRGEKVLIHCHMGISRSATIVIAYLMRYGITGSLVESPISYSDAFDFLKEKRPIICPNLGFTMALYEWDIIGEPADMFKIA
jgi:hypothetical protein